jgi:hypothetical protein
MKLTESAGDAKPISDGFFEDRLASGRKPTLGSRLFGPR